MKMRFRGMIGSPEGNNEDDGAVVPDRACSEVEEGKLACWDCFCD